MQVDSLRSFGSNLGMAHIESRSRAPAADVACFRHIIAVNNCLLILTQTLAFVKIPDIMPHMPFTWLFSQPLVFGAWVAAILVSLTIHEFSHAASALAFGDDTAKSQKRLTLNPLVHIDPLGFVLLLTAGFGWAKPVPVNPYNLRPQRLGSAMVSIAGPFSNFILIIISIIALKLITPLLGPANLLVNFVFMLALINLTLFLFNLIPLPPLDGSKVLYAVLPVKYGEFKEKMEQTGPWILFMLIIADNFLNIGIFSAIFSWAFAILGRFL